MAELEIIDAEIVPQPQHAFKLTNTLDISNQAKGESDVADLVSLSPVYTRAEREAALRLLSPSLHDVVMGAGWVDSHPSHDNEEGDSSDDNDVLRRASSASSSSSFSSPSTPPSFSPLASHTSITTSLTDSNLSDALLVRSCSQGWSLSFELSPTQPIPRPSHPDEILIRNEAVGLNPVDWKSVSYNFGIPAFPWILGRDIAGTIIQPPSNNAEGWKVGDRVWTCADSREKSAGGYQRFSVHKKGTLARIPNEVQDEEAASLGTGLITAAVALFAFFSLPYAALKEEDLIEEKLKRVDINQDHNVAPQQSDWIL